MSIQEQSAEVYKRAISKITDRIADKATTLGVSVYSDNKRSVVGLDKEGNPIYSKPEDHMQSLKKDMESAKRAARLLAKKVVKEGRRMETPYENDKPRFSLFNHETGQAHHVPTLEHALTLRRTLIKSQKQKSGVKMVDNKLGKIVFAN